MGGSAVLFYGELEAQRQAPRPGLLSRVFGAKAGPAATDGFVDLPSKDFRAIAADFHSFIKSRLPNPSVASKVMLDYLRTAGPNVYLRGELDAQGRRRWYVQLSFSACAGLADTSADVAAHWAGLWYEANRERIDETLLRPHGFAAESIELIHGATMFLPVGQGGYAGYQGAPEDGEDRYFAIDVAALEADEEEADRVHAWLEANGAALIAQGGCHCQLCAPGFDPALIPGFGG